MKANINFYQTDVGGGQFVDTPIPVSIEIDGIEFAPVNCGVRAEFPFEDDPREQDRFARVCRALVAAAKNLLPELPDRSIPDYETIMGGGQ